MNKRTDTKLPPNEFTLKRNHKIRDIILIAALGIFLMFATWKIFNTKDSATALASIKASENEQKVSRLLEEIEGVGEASVMICETEEGVVGVVVVCEGAKDFQVVMNVREAVAAALGTQQKAVKIYLKKA